MKAAATPPRQFNVLQNQSNLMQTIVPPTILETKSLNNG
jgi:hypothetical protein